MTFVLISVDYHPTSVGWIPVALSPLICDWLESLCIRPAIVLYLYTHLGGKKKKKKKQQQQKDFVLISLL